MMQWGDGDDELILDGHGYGDEESVTKKNMMKTLKILLWIYSPLQFKNIHQEENLTFKKR